jgi:hypothetical protein
MAARRVNCWDRQNEKVARQIKSWATELRKSEFRDNFKFPMRNNIDQNIKVSGLGKAAAEDGGPRPGNEDAWDN